MLKAYCFLEEKRRIDAASTTVQVASHSDLAGRVAILLGLQLESIC
jgi:hypothetical protein